MSCSQSPWTSIEKPSEATQQWCYFHVPFLTKTDYDVIISNGRSKFTTTNLLKSNPPLKTPPTLKQWLAANYPKLSQINLAFSIGASYAGDVLPEDMKRDLRECCKAVGTVLKDDIQIDLKVGNPSKFDGFEASEAERLRKVQGILRRC